MQLASENKVFKYFKYAIGEIVLVVIGILIAIQVNNWNENRKLSDKELDLLSNLRNEMISNISYLRKSDSVFELHEEDSKKALQKFYIARSVKDIRFVDSLTRIQWDYLLIDMSTYDEMISSNSIYSIKNQDLRESIVVYYGAVDRIKTYLEEITRMQTMQWSTIVDLYPYKFLISQFDNQQVDIESIDTSWIINPNSPTYLAVNNYLQSNLDYNIVTRRAFYRTLLQLSESLESKISIELENRRE